MDGSFDWYEFLIWFYSWFTDRSVSWYDPSTGTLGETSGEAAFTNISVRDINYSLCIFPIVNIGLAVAVFCSA